MKIIKRVNHLVLILTMIVSFQINAESIQDATWYLSMDIDQLQNNEIVKILKGENSEIEIPQELTYLTVYGDSRGVDDATAVVTGDFRHFSIANHVLDLLYTKKEASQMIKEDSLLYHDHEVKIIMVRNDGEEGEDEFKKIYFSKINDNLSVVSLHLNEVKNWIDNVYGDLDINKDSLFAVVVNVESALAHMGMNLDDNSHMMHSKIFQKVSQVSASVTEVADDILLEVALSANDEAAATLIEQVINGLVAMHNLSNANNNELHAILMQNLTIERNANNVLINTYAALAELKKMDMDKQLNGEKKTVVKLKPLKFN
ncbi:MAG: hypothetical protein JKY19_14110 [Alcanivoracaceae bacterium]|nr:hypothetical protein [Alcanivoracaceae bacterium]